MVRMSGTRAAGLILAFMAFPMFLTGGLLTMLLGVDFAFTPLILGLVFVVLGVVLMAIPVRPRPFPPTPVLATFPAPPPAIAAPRAFAPEPTKIVCPSCGASPSHVTGSGLVTCEYCGASYVI